MAAVPTVALSGGTSIPRLAFGVGTAVFGKPASSSVELAINSGFRLLDNANGYKNEDTAGEAIAAALSSGKVKRSDLFVLTKLTTGMDDIAGTARTQLKALQCGHLDALLLHLPPRGKNGLPSNVEAWKQVEKLKDDGIAKAIGVSNWLASDLQEVLDSKPKYKPELNQIEFHPLLYASPQYRALVPLMQKEHIVPMTYAQLGPLTKLSSSAGPVLDAAERIAAAHGAGWNSGIVLLKWAYQRSEGILVTTTSKKERAEEYVGAFSKGANDLLSEEEAKEIDEAGEKAGVQKIYMTDYF